MTTSTGTRKERNVQSRANEALTEGDKDFIQSLKVFSESSNDVAGLAGGAINNSPKTPAGNYLAREGDSMIGPIAFGPPIDFTIDIDSSNTIDIGPLNENPQFSSNLQLEDIQPNSFVLDIIANANFDGQLLVLRTFAPSTPITISQGTVGNGGNIQTSDDEDITMGDLQMIILVFDEALKINANTGGTWRVLAGAGGDGAGTGTFISADLVADQTANVAVGNHIEFDRNIPPEGADGGIVLQTGAGQANGIFELIGGKTYFLSAQVSPIKSVVPTQLVMAWFDRTNDNEIGRRSLYDVDNTINLDNQPNNQIIFTPATNVDVDLRIISITPTPTNLTGFFAITTSAHIFEFSGQNGISPTIEPTTWKLPARAKSTVDVTDVGNADVIFDSITLVQGDRVLLTEQTDLSENGLYVVGVVSSGFAPLTRPADFDTSAEVLSETFVAIEEGNLFKNQVWHLITNNPITIDVSDQLWEQFAPGLSGGPDMGGGEDGIDGDGQFVNDGRIGIGSSILKIWQKIEFPANTNPNNRRSNLIYMPSQDTPSLSGRLLYNALSNNTRGGAFSDDYGETWTISSSLTSNNGYGRMAYAPNLGTNGTLTIIRSQPGFAAPEFKMQVSSDRGTSFSTTTMPNNGQDFVDQIFVESLGLFVATAAGVNTASTLAVYTSPDGSTWTARTTPAPTNVFAGWFNIVFSPTLGKFYVKNNATGVNDPEFITSVDGVTWLGPFVHDMPVSIPRRIIWSEGQQKFAAAGSGQGVFFSDDFITWTNTTPADLASAADIVWAPDLSLWVVIGSNTFTSFVNPMIWASNDSVNWTTFPKNNFRTVPTSISNERVQIAYSEEFQYFFGMNSGFGTTQQQFYRTGQRR